MTKPIVHEAGAIRVTGLTGIKHLQEPMERTFLRMLADTGVNEIRTICQSGIFKHPTGALANSIRGRVEGKAVVWWSDVAHASAQEYGVKPHQMWYLMGKTVPITIYKFGGEIKIFRKVSLKSLIEGKWMHPGYPGKFFFKQGIEMALSQIPDLLDKARKVVIQLKAPDRRL